MSLILESSFKEILRGPQIGQALWGLGFKSWVPLQLPSKWPSQCFYFMAARKLP